MIVKICGLKRKCDVDVAVKNNADMIGFVFAKSRRQISYYEAFDISKSVPKHIKKVGVFVNPSLEEVNKAIQISKIDMVQLHGEESIDFIRKINVPVIKAIKMTDENSIKEIAKYTECYLLLDAPPEEYEGGSGKTFDWEKFSDIELPKERLIIAGGLNAYNVKKAIKIFNPLGVDVSSGVETNKEKDIKKIEEFINKAKGENIDEI